MTADIFRVRLQLEAFTKQKPGPKALDITFTVTDLCAIGECLAQAARTNKGEAACFFLQYQDALTLSNESESTRPEELVLGVTRTEKLYILADSGVTVRPSIPFAYAELVSAAAHREYGRSLICSSARFAKDFNEGTFLLRHRSAERYRVEASAAWYVVDALP